jgi:hypothetical protein
MRMLVVLSVLIGATGYTTEPPVTEPIQPQSLRMPFALDPSDPSLNRSESELLRRLADTIEEQPITARTVAGDFGLKGECATQGCDFGQTRIGGMVSRKGRLSFDRNGLMFQLDEISGECVRANVISRQFSGGGVEQSCADAQCWYYSVRQDWGTLSFGLPDPGGPCVKSVIVDTYRSTN